MPIERLREYFKADAQHFYALGRNKEPAMSKPKAAAPEVISVSSTATTSARSTGDSSSALPRARARPLILSDEEDEEETDPEEEPESRYDSEVEILPSPPVQPQPRYQPIKTVGVVSQPKPLQPFNGVNRTAPIIGLGTPIHIPSNKDLYKPPTRLPARLSGGVPHTTGPEYTQTEPPIDDDLNDVMSAKETEKALKELISGSMNEDESEIDPSDKIVEGFRKEFSLLDHQVIGRKWMMGREDVQAKKYGGILADDMGLGKTIQTLARIVDNPATADDRSDGWAKSTLVVCPLALVGQWADEIKRMTSLTVIKHQGTSRTTDPLVLAKHRVVVTTYETVASEYAAFSPAAKDESKGSKSSSQAITSQVDSDSDDADHFGRKVVTRTAASKRKAKNALFQIRWFRIVLDEAHNIKNHSTKRSVACCELEGRFRWCLTGTPLQNNVGELYPLLKFLRIRPWNRLDRFNPELAKPIQNGGRGAGRAMKRLQFILRQIMLRRSKNDVLNGKKLIELPNRTVEIISCPFDPSEKAFYDSLESKMGDVLEDIMKEKEGSKYMSVLLLLLRLRQACNHPLLVTKDYKKDLEAVDSQAAKKDGGDVDADDLVAAFEQLGVERKCQMCTVTLSVSNTSQGKWSGHCVACVPLAQEAELAERDRPTSAKIRMILKLLREIDERSEKKEKTIIFSQFTSMLDLIEPFLKEKGIRFVRYDGSMSPIDREATLVKIKSSPDVRVILISFKAGSTGLNLTACNNVILVDMWWNPALEDQAFDRAHRFGQTRDVNIFKLKVDNTVEERILLLQDNKRALAQAALSGDKLKNMKLGMEDLLALFRPSARDEEDEE